MIGRLWETRRANNEPDGVAETSDRYATRSAGTGSSSHAHGFLSCGLAQLVKLCASRSYHVWGARLHLPQICSLTESAVVALHMCDATSRGKGEGISLSP